MDLNVIICNTPDRKGSDQPPHAEISKADAGLAFRNIPIKLVW
jgi:protein tyrosine phosphatase (PTP) superfamily phosphohydrolase (DUF442 family)